jgi:hypothetical protein
MKQISAWTTDRWWLFKLKVLVGIDERMTIHPRIVFETVPHLNTMGEDDENEDEDDDDQVSDLELMLVFFQRRNSLALELFVCRRLYRRM